MERFYSLKCEVADLEEMEGRLFELTESLGTEFEQEDVYFRAFEGTLKLRIMPPSHVGTLISTVPVSISGAARLIDTSSTDIEDVEALTDTLDRSLGIIDSVEKVRRVFTLPDARIYLDHVKEIGLFVEILVGVVATSPTEEDESCEERARKRTKEIAAALGVTDDKSVGKSYIELVSLAKKPAPLTAFIEGRQPQRS